ncbi:MAG: hypothetical protein GTO41_01930 [Burkholderiales bacterium]|nr:hypothetical protein [Burkholderiales bacterium]
MQFVIANSEKLVPRADEPDEQKPKDDFTYQVDFDEQQVEQEICEFV